MCEVEVWEDEARAGSFLLSQGLEREHKPIRDLIERYREDFEDFSLLKKRKLRVSPTHARSLRIKGRNF